MPNFDCRACRHYGRWFTGHCYQPELFAKYGDADIGQYPRALIMRDIPEACGSDGYYWDKREANPMKYVAVLALLLWAGLLLGLHRYGTLPWGVAGMLALLVVVMVLVALNAMVGKAMAEADEKLRRNWDL